MSRVAFEWDGAKAAANWRKHRITFPEAATAFNDEAGFLLDDPSHSATEQRFLQFGRTASGRLVVVAYSYQEGIDVIRIISARSATGRERSIYESRNSP